MKKLIFAVAVAAVATMAVVLSASAGNGTGIAATPASTITWSGGTAQFVRSASGIINETKRIDAALVNGLQVYVQFRPLTGPGGTGDPIPNPNCDPNGLVMSFAWSNTDPALGGTPTGGYFIGTNPYNACLYYVPDQVVATGTIDSSAFAGTTASLPISGHYRIDVSGTYVNDGNNVADAEYTSVDNWTTHMDGYDITPYFLGAGFGDVQVNGGFVDWGAYHVNHVYSLTTALTGTSVNLAVFDGDSNTNTKNPGWYSDNSGLLNYTITYVGP